MDYIFESFFCTLGAVFLLSAIIATLVAKKDGDLLREDMNVALNLFVLSGSVTLIFGARLIYLLAKDAAVLP